MEISIDGRQVGAKHPPYIIAELSANHNGSLERAKRTIDAAYRNGADAVKLQTYTPDTMTIDCSNEYFRVKEGPWKGRNLYELYKEAHTPFEWHNALFKYARDLGLTVFSTPFDETAVDLLEELNTPAYKIASFEITDIPLISYAASKKKPLIISTGMASEDEIDAAIEAAGKAGCNEIILLHCVSSYPAPTEQANLKRINSLQQKYAVPVGLSDHTIGNLAAICSVGLGAVAIEKHFTLSRTEKGPDSEFSMEPHELLELSKQSELAWCALGNGAFELQKTEKSSNIFRRSLFFVEDLVKGTVIKRHHIRRIRPGNGLAPSLEAKLIGKRLSQDVHRGQPTSWDVFH